MQCGITCPLDNNENNINYCELFQYCAKTKENAVAMREEIAAATDQVVSKWNAKLADQRRGNIDYE